ncbi:MAG: hypothetical protein KME14_19270 [Tildeniella torsiva UHER 1998/13D]|jgi:hypothetical protein|nr:hypothetical protein [Tildeniella torsiva UHER 1998/13D]
MQQKEVLSVKEFYDYAVRQLERELNLINNRISWMLTFQGFLFAAIALVANQNTDQAIRTMFGIVVPIIGIAVAFLALVGVHAAYLSIKDIKETWKKKLGHWEYSPAFGTPRSSLLGRVPSYGIPVSIIIAWFIFLVGLVGAS